MSTAVEAIAAREAGLEVLGLRFRSDRLVPSERFRFLESAIGSADLPALAGYVEARLGGRPQPVIPQRFLRENAD